MAKDKIHTPVKEALIDEGWTITDDPLYIKVGNLTVFVDLGAERVFGAEKDGERIAVEVKTFGNPSFMTALYEYRKNHKMDNKIKKYQEAILNILSEYSKIKYSNVQGDNQIIADKDNNRFLIMTIGWQKNHFVHDCPMHFDIINGKVWVQSNMTEWNVGEMLEEQGISKTDIVLGFLAPSTRAYSEYALA